MIMSEFEIRQSYKLARHPHRQVAILAQLNAIPIKEVKNILSKPPKILIDIEETMTELYNKYMTDKEIAQKVGCSKSKVHKWRRLNGLDAQYIRIKKER